eukprot:11385880-Alexandrium_andersonii.AAC.1
MHDSPHSVHLPVRQKAVGALCDRGGGTHVLPSGGHIDCASPPWREARARPACVHVAVTSCAC